MTRVVNLRHEPYDVYIGRGSPYGNQWTHIKGKTTKALYVVDTVEEAIAEYNWWVQAQPDLIARIKKRVDREGIRVLL